MWKTVPKPQNGFFENRRNWFFSVWIWRSVRFGFSKTEIRHFHRFPYTPKNTECSTHSSVTSHTQQCHTTNKTSPNTVSYYHSMATVLDRCILSDNGNGMAAAHYVWRSALLWWNANMSRSSELHKQTDKPTNITLALSITYLVAVLYTHIWLVKCSL